jgi:hypothetical protein
VSVPCTCCGLSGPGPDCRYCSDTGTVALPAGHPQAPGIDCPACRPGAYPDGFPGLLGLLPGAVLIPPIPART